jgi:hypothetical protein
MLAAKGDELLLSELLPQQHLARCTESYQGNVVLPRSIPTERICIAMILLEPANKILQTSGEDQAADHLINGVLTKFNPPNSLAE